MGNQLSGREELASLRDVALELRGDLAAARAQRDGTQRALDKANRDNDALRAEIRSLKASLAAERVTAERLARRNNELELVVRTFVGDQIPESATMTSVEAFIPTHAPIAITVDSRPTYSAGDASDEMSPWRWEGV